MNTSIETKEIFTALIKAQGEFRVAVKDASNPFFKSKYADLESVVDSVMPALSKYELGFIQPTYADEKGNVFITTRIIHSSGQYIESLYPVLPVKNDPQAWGSAITYARRYSLSAMLGVVTGEDDDGNKASTKPEVKNYAPQVNRELPKNIIHQKPVVANNAITEKTQVLPAHKTFVFKGMNPAFEGKTFAQCDQAALDGYFDALEFKYLVNGKNTMPNNLMWLFNNYKLHKNDRNPKEKVNFSKIGRK